MMSEEKLCLITGANSGIGLAKATALATQGHHVVMVCRSEEKANLAIDSVVEAGGRRPDLILGDLSLIADTKRVAREFLSTYDRLDVLINNAGGYFPSRIETEEGLELNFALNHMAYFVLTEGVRPLLESTPSSRIVSVASRAHRKAQLDFDDLQWRDRRYSPFTVYGTSKLLNILFTRELARELEGTGTTANCYHPGVVRTGFGQDYSSLFNLATRVAGLMFLSPEKGADTGLYLATSDEVAEVSGQYFAKRRTLEPRPAGRNDAHARQLWELSLELSAQFT